MAAHARAEVRSIVRYGHGARWNEIEDVGLERAVEALQQENPPYECGPDLDAPPGRYIVRSRSEQREGRTAYWYIVLDPERGTPVAAHNCPLRAAYPKAQCRHMAAAWLCWKAERDRDNPDNFLRRLQMSESTALAPYEERQALTPYYLPNERDIKDTLALAEVLLSERAAGQTIPATLDTPAKAAAVILAGRELGFDPMTSFRRFYIVNGQTQLDAQGIVALVQRAGGDIVYHETTDTVADVEIVRPGRASVRVRYTMEQAVKAGSTKNKYGDKAVWTSHPADMLIWKAVTRAGKRGAADLINAIEGAMVRLDDIADYAPERRGTLEDMPAALITEDHGEQEPPDVTEAEYREGDEPCPESAPADTEPKTTPTTSAPPPTTAGHPEAGSGSGNSAPATTTAEGESWRSVAYADAMANKAHYFKELSDFQKALGRKAKPDGYEDMSLGAIVDGAA